MYGDFSRGHQPDRARGRDYRRVLLEMGRPVLDSDVAASVDALLGEIQKATRGLGCAAGSPDLGFLVTPGRLVTIFSEVADRVRAPQGAPNVWVDYRFRFADRYPAVNVVTTGQPARVVFPVLHGLPAGSDVTLWVWAQVATTLTVNGATVPVPSTAGGAAVPVRFTVTGRLDEVDITVPAGEVWLYLLEEHQPVGTLGAFAVAAGTYQLDGLVVEMAGGGPFPQVAFPASAGFGWNAVPPSVTDLLGLTLTPVADQFAVAYLEVWERHISAVEDPGIREVALGATDTSTRTQLLGQVKLAPLATGITRPDLEAQIGAAFAAVEISGGELTIDVPQGSPSTDPCALPEVGGYSGGDNRLYRIEVHRGGPLSTVALKWSRDNGSELFAAELSPEHTLLFPAGTPLAAGDIVEVLSSVVDLGDDVIGQVRSGGFVPAERAVGQLGQLLAVPTVGGEDSVQFGLAAVDDVTNVLSIDDRGAVLSDARLKVRRWHGLLDPRQLAGGTGTAAAGPYVLEDGITVTLSTTGEFRPGQYWQYQARVGGTQAEQPWQPSPHGPRRRFAPLALLHLPATATTAEPWELVAWLDERFSSPCDLEADDVAFYGERVDTPADTVQEALEELYGRIPAPQVWPRITRIGWRNDRTLPFSQFQTGLQVRFSEEMDPVTASSASFVVSLEVPVDAKPQLRQPLIVDGKVTVSGLNWTFVPDTVSPTDVANWSKALGGGVRCRVRLASDVILGRRGGRPLDGDAVGVVQVDGYETFVELQLPSGDGQRGGDFHSWFYLEAPPPSVRVEGIDPADGAIITPAAQLGAVLISFTEAVRFASLNDTTVIVSMTAQGQRVSRRIPGTISPYPFEADARLVSRVTFAPTEPDAFRPAPGLLRSPQVFTVQLRGSGDRPIQDSEGRPLDGAGSGEPSDIAFQFTVQQAP